MADSSIVTHNIEVEEVPAETMIDDESHASSDSPPRRYGIVKYYNSRRGQHYGFISDMGIAGTSEPLIEDRIYFHRTSLRDTGSSSVVLVQMPINTVVEYVLETRMSDGKPSYRAVDITNLHELRLPCQLGIVTFTPYHVALKKMTRDQVAGGQSHFEHLLEHMDGTEGTSQSIPERFSTWRNE